MDHIFFRIGLLTHLGLTLACGQPSPVDVEDNVAVDQFISAGLRHWESDAQDSALWYFRQAYHLADLSGSDRDRALSAGHLGRHFLYNLGKVSIAEDYLHSQRDILESNPGLDSSQLSRNYIDLSFLHIKKLELPFAKSYAMMARALASQLTPIDSLLMAKAYIALGHVLWYGLEEERVEALNSYHTAEAYLPNTKEGHALSNRVLIGLINIFNNTSQPDSSIYYLDRYYTDKENRNPETLGNYYRLYGISHYLQKDYKTSIVNLQEAISQFQQHQQPDPYAYADAFLVLSAAFQKDGQYTRALQSADSALIRHFGTTHDLGILRSDIASISFYSSRAEVIADSAMHNGDTSSAKEALDIYQSVDSLRRQFIKLDVDTYLHQQFYDNYYYAKRMEILAFLYRNTGKEKWLHQIHDLITTYKAQGLNRDKILNQLYHSPAGQSLSFTNFVKNDLALESATQAKDYKQINTLLRERQRIIAQMYQEIPEHIEKLINSRNISSQDLLDYSTEHETAVINYYIGNTYYNEDHIYILTAAHGKFSLEVLDQSAEVLELADTLYQMHKIAASSPSIFDTIGYYKLNYTLYKKLFASTSDSLMGVSNLILIPDQKLHFVSFEGLVTNDPESHGDQEDSVVAHAKYLIQDFNITYAYSPNDLIDEATESKAEYSLGLLAMGFSSKETLGAMNGGKDVQELNSSYRELQALEQLYGRSEGKYFYGYNCTKENFLRYAGEAEIIHISTHGAYDPEDRTSSVLYLRNKKGIEKLYPHEIRYRDIHPRLIVLSACDSGAGKASNEEGMFSIGRTFQAFGAEQVISALWPLSGNASAEFCELFYRNLLQQQDAATALRNAKQKMSLQHNRYAMPGYWSALVMHY